MSDETLKVILVAGGWTLETSGIVLIAAAELFPRLGKLGGRLLRTLRRAGNAVRRLLRLPPRGHFYIDAEPGTMTLSGSAVEVVTRAETASDKEKLEFLLSLGEELQHRLGRVENRLDELPKQWKADVEATRVEVQRASDERLEAARNEFIGVRLLGLPLVVAGASMLAASSFV